MWHRVNWRPISTLFRGAGGRGSGSYRSQTPQTLRECETHSQWHSPFFELRLTTIKWSKRRSNNNSIRQQKEKHIFHLHHQTNEKVAATIDDNFMGDYSRGGMYLYYKYLSSFKYD